MIYFSYIFLVTLLKQQYFLISRFHATPRVNLNCSDRWTGQTWGPWKPINFVIRRLIICITFFSRPLKKPARSSHTNPMRYAIRTDHHIGEPTGPDSHSGTILGTEFNSAPLPPPHFFTWP